jgi:hypothetical protein
MEQNNVLTKLLAEMSKVHLQEKQKRLDFKMQGKYFNIFDVLQLSRNEVRLHSAFIAELLNPSGSHGLGDKFLKAFVETVFGNRDQKFSGNDFIKRFDTKSAMVKTEHSIGSINEKGDEGGRIDLFIKDKNNNAIIIENKIDAYDQSNQLIRYRNYAEKEKLNYKLLYLTKYGSPASENSAGKDAKYYIPISYRQDIFSWLNKCIGISAMIPPVRETIYQYIINLKEILDIMDDKNINKIVNLATDEKYLNATLDIINNSWNIKVQLRKEFIQKLEEKAKECGLRVDDENGEELENMAKLGNYAYIYFMPNSSKDDKWAFCIGWDKYTEGLCYGISTHNCDGNNKVTCDQGAYENPPQNAWPLGWSAFGRLDYFTNWKELTEYIIQTLTSEFKKTEELIKRVKEAEKKCL